MWAISDKGGDTDGTQTSRVGELTAFAWRGVCNCKTNIATGESETHARDSLNRHASIGKYQFWNIGITSPITGWIARWASFANWGSSSYQFLGKAAFLSGYYIPWGQSQFMGYRLIAEKNGGGVSGPDAFRCSGVPRKCRIIALPVTESLVWKNATLRLAIWSSYAGKVRILPAPFKRRVQKNEPRFRKRER